MPSRTDEVQRMYEIAVQAIGRDSNIRLTHTTQFIILNITFLAAIWALYTVQLDNPLPFYAKKNAVIRCYLSMGVSVFAILINSIWYAIIRRLRHGNVFRYHFLGMLEMEMYPRHERQYMREMQWRGYDTTKIEKSWESFGYLGQADFQNVGNKTVPNDVSWLRSLFNFWPIIQFRSLFHKIDTAPPGNVSGNEGTLPRLFAALHLVFIAMDAYLIWFCC